MQCHYTTKEVSEATKRNVCGAAGTVYQVRREGYSVGEMDPVAFQLVLCEVHAAEVRNAFANEPYTLEEVCNEN